MYIPTTNNGKLSNAPINVKPQGGGRRGGGGASRPRGILHFHKRRSQISHPWAPRTCQIPTLGYRFLPKTGLSHVKFPTSRQSPNVKILTQGKARQVTFLCVAHSPSLPPWGLINNYSSSPNGLWINSPWGRRPKAEWAIDAKAMRAREIIFLVISN